MRGSAGEGVSARLGVLVPGAGVSARGERGAGPVCGDRLSPGWGSAAGGAGGGERCVGKGLLGPGGRAWRRRRAGAGVEGCAAGD